MHYYFVSILFLLFSCTNKPKEQPIAISVLEVNPVTIVPSGTSIADRFPSPQGYSLTASDSMSFAYYLQHLRLKPLGTKVKYYDGATKEMAYVSCSVIDMDIDPVDLQQCADAAMRLRGEYLFAQNKIDEIKFNFLSDGKPRYFKTYANGNYSYQMFRKYMKYIFSYANTRSLNNELKSRPINQMQIGDILILIGNPYGHAVTIVNMAQDTSGNKLFMLAQSYMPAQETEILINPSDEKISPWYALKEGDILRPQWLFSSTDLKHF